jgi:hypothetical protein
MRPEITDFLRQDAATRAPLPDSIARLRAIAGKL